MHLREQKMACHATYLRLAKAPWKRLSERRPSGRYCFRLSMSTAPGSLCGAVWQGCGRMDFICFDTVS